MSRSSCAISSLRVARSFSQISDGKIHLSFSRVWCGSHSFVTASRVRTQQPISRRSLGAQWLLASSSLQHVLTRLSRGFTEEYSRRRFLFVLSLFDGVFDRRKWDILAALSPLCFCGHCLFRRARAGRVAVDFSRAIRRVKTWQNPTFKRAENLIKLYIQIGADLSKPYI